MLYISPLSLVSALAVLVQVQATFYVTSPTPPAQCILGQECTVTWINTDTDPVDDNVGLCAVALYSAETQEKVEGLTTVNLNQDNEFQFIPAAQFSQAGQEYYINFTSLSPVGSPPQYFEMFSPYFTIADVSSSPLGVQPTSTVVLPGASQFPPSAGSSFAPGIPGLGTASGGFVTGGTTVYFSGGQQIFPSSASGSPASPAAVTTTANSLAAPNVNSAQVTSQQTVSAASQDVFNSSPSGTVLSVSATSSGGSNSGGSPLSDGALNPSATAAGSSSGLNQTSSAMSLHFKPCIRAFIPIIGLFVAYII